MKTCMKRTDKNQLLLYILYNIFMEMKLVVHIDEKTVGMVHSCEVYIQAVNIFSTNWGDHKNAVFDTGAEIKKRRKTQSDAILLS